MGRKTHHYARTVWFWTDGRRIDHVDTHGHGKAPRCNWVDMPATVRVDDGYGRIYVYRFFYMRADDAVYAVARIWGANLREDQVLRREGMSKLVVEKEPADFRDTFGDPVEGRYPNLLMWA
jgi:hypothetical protein